MAIKQEIIDELLKGYKNPEDLLGEEGLFKALKKALVERALSAELTDHLGYEAHAPKGRKSGNSRNGHGSKRITGEDGDMTIAVTAMPVLNRRSSAKLNAALTALMTKLSPCMRGGCQNHKMCARYAATWKNFTALRYRPICYPVLLTK